MKKSIIKIIFTLNLFLIYSQITLGQTTKSGIGAAGHATNGI
jgi:hypothetical protein